MSKDKFQVSIPDPCTQAWSDMTPAEGGRFCAHCQHEVIDFSLMTIELKQSNIDLPEIAVVGYGARTDHPSFQAKVSVHLSPVFYHPNNFC